MRHITAAVARYPVTAAYLLLAFIVTTVTGFTS